MIKSAFPKSVEYRGHKAAIYLQNQRGYQRYEVCVYDVDGIQQRFTFTTSEDAKEFAEATVQEITRNRLNFLTLRGQETYEYQQVVRLLAPTDLALRDVANIVVESDRLLEGGTGLLDAAEYFVDQPRRPASYQTCA